MFKKVIIGISVFAALFAVLIFSGKIPIGGGSNAPVGAVTVWGTVPQDTMDTLLQDFNTQAKTYRVSYKEIKEDVFINTLVGALADGNGPDMILAPYQIILSQTSRVYPYPTTSVSEKTFKDSFVDGASIFWTPYGAVALPVSIEPLVLFYNRTLLSKHGVVNPPSYWDELTNMVSKLTVRDSNGAFIENAIGFGVWNNVPYVKDILVAMVNQLGEPAVLQEYTDSGVNYNVLINTPLNSRPDVYPLTTVVRFFTQFSDQSKPTVYTWNQFLPSAQSLFIAEKLAMYIGYSGEYTTMHESNQKMDIGMTYLPQMKDYNTFATGMRMYGVATLRSTKNAPVALAAQAALAGGQWSPIIASSLNAQSALRGAAATTNVNEVISKSMLNAHGFPDVHPNETNNLFAQMINDIISGKLLINDAVDTFVSRFTNLYTGTK